jgi:hypothetical protein
MLNVNTKHFVETLTIAIGMFCFGKMFGNDIHVCITFPVAVIGFILSCIVLLDGAIKRNEH